MSIHDNAEAARQKIYDDAINQVQQELTAVTAQRDQALTNFDYVTEQLNELSGKHTTLQKNFDALKSEYEEYKRTHPDVPSVPQKKTLVGSSASRISGESSNAQAVARIEATCGPLQIVRVYDENVGPTRALQRAREGGLGKRAVSVSFKEPPAEVIAGRHDDAIKAFATALKNERGSFPVYVTYEHECDTKVINGGYTAEQHRNASSRVIDLMKAIDPGLHMTLILTGFKFNERIGNFYLPKYDVVAVDPYSHKAADDAAVLINNFGMLKWFTDNKVRWAITETGQHADDLASLVTLVKSYKKWTDLGAEFYCHFNAMVYSGTTLLDDFRIDNRPEAAAAFKALPRG